MADTITFPAEVIKLEAKKLASGDKGYRLTLETDNPEVVKLEKFIAEQVVSVEVKNV